MPGRIAQRTIELVEERADLVELVAARTGPPRRSGGQFLARCPFHDERTPSLSIEPSAKLYHCFGCGAAGNVFRFVQELEGLSFGEAVEYLADRYGVEVEREDLAPGEERALAERARIESLLEQTTAFYARFLAVSPQAAAAREYLEGRGITGELIDRFRLGFAPPSWERVVAAARGKGYRDDEIEAAGIASRGRRGLIDRFRGRLMFPLADARGRVRGFGARVMPGDEGPKYLNSPESEHFHKGRILYGLHLARPAIARRGRAIVVEGYTDVIALHAAGFDEAVAAMGTSLTEDQLRELGRLASTLTLCFDADAAGEEAALRGVRAALARDLRVRIVPLPAGRDPADLLADGREAFEHALEAAQTVLAFEVGRVLDRHGELGIDDTYAAARTVLAAAPATPERDEQVRRVASALRLDPETQAALVRPAGRTATPARSAARVRRRLDAHARLEREFLAAALALPGRGRALLSGEDVSGLLEQPEHAALLPWLRQRLDGGAAPPPPGLEPVAAEVVASAARYGLDGERAGPEEEGEQDRVLEHLWLRLQLHHLERRMTPLKEMLDSDDYSREGEQELSNLARAAEAIRHRMRAGGG